MNHQFTVKGSVWSFIIHMMYMVIVLTLLIVKIIELINPRQEPEGHLNDQTKEGTSHLTRKIIAKHRAAIVERILLLSTTRSFDGARKFQGETIKLETFRDMNSSIYSGLEIPTTNECSICLEQFDEEISDKILLKCNHMFHKDCLVPWLECSMSCPDCRTSVFTLHDMVKAAVELKLVEQ